MTRGGKRAGAGAPKKKNKKISRNFRIDPDLVKRMDEHEWKNIKLIEFGLKIALDS